MSYDGEGKNPKDPLKYGLNLVGNMFESSRNMKYNIKNSSLSSYEIVELCIMQIIQKH